MLIKPRRLTPGDTVAAVTPSWGGPHTFPHRYQAGKRQLEQTFGVRVVETRHALRDAAWLADNPQARAEDLMEAFADPQVRAIVATIGGEDSIRLLPHLDLGVIRDNPKIFMGYSDITVSHLACLKAGLVSFYGPTVMAGFAENGGVFPYTEDAVRRALFSAAPIGAVSPNTSGWTVEFLDWARPELQSQRRALQPTAGWRWLQGGGVASGPLIGGCLEVLDWLRGTELWPGPELWRGALLFLETSEEAPSPTYVARVLRTFAAVGALGQVGAILFGRPGGNIPVEQHAGYDAAILRVVAEEQGLAGLPVITNMDFGHTDPMMVLPYGVRAQVDCAAQTFTILEGAVVEG